jgi:hypothetical protein
VLCDHTPNGLTRTQEGTRLSATNLSGIDDKKCASAGGGTHLPRLTEGSELRRLAKLQGDAFGGCLRHMGLELSAICAIGIIVAINSK